MTIQNARSDILSRFVSAVLTGNDYCGIHGETVATYHSSNVQPSHNLRALAKRRVFCLLFGFWSQVLCVFVTNWIII